MTSHDTTSYNSQSKQTLAGAKLLAVGEINVVEASKNSAICVAATPQEIMYSPIGNFQHQGGASLDAIITPFQINSSSTKLPTMPTSADSTCVVSQSSQVDPPISDWTPPIINVSYLNPFKRPSDPSHGQGDHYDGTIVFNGDKDDNQNLVNSTTFPTDLRPMALRGPLVVQGWGYDLNGKPIPNKVDDATSAQAGVFEEDNLEDEFLDDWIEQRETWPVAPVDLRYDRARKVWTVPNTFRIIQVSLPEDTTGIQPGATEADCIPLNINPVYGSDGSEVVDPTISVTNPSWNTTIPSGENFYAFYDTKDCKYYPLTSQSGCEPTVTGTGSITVTKGSGSGGCPQYIVSGCVPKVTGIGGITVTSEKVSGCDSYTISGSGMCAPVVTGVGSITVTSGTVSGCTTYTVSGTGGGCVPTITGMGGISVAKTGECDFTISGCTPIGIGNITVTETGDCYEISGCEPSFYPKGNISITSTGECGYIISGYVPDAPCLPTVTGAGSIEVTSTVVGECTEYLVSGCIPSITGGGGITVTGEGCDFTISGCQPTFEGFGSITVDNTGECEYTISGCSTRVEGLGGGVVVSHADEGDCKVYYISGVGPPGVGSAQYRDIAYGCGWTPVTTSCTTLPCLDLAEGLQLNGTVLSSPLLKLNSTWDDVCAPAPLVTDIAAGLTFGNNLMASKNGCNWAVWGLDQKISATQMVCPAVDAVGPNITFKELSFDNNISVVVDAACKATIKGRDQKIAGTLAAGVCDLTNIVGVKDFKKLTFADNLGVKLDAGEDCDYTIKGLDQKVTATEQSCIQGSQTFLGQDFTKLIFSDNIGVSQNVCEMTIKGLDQKIESTAQPCILDSQTITEVMDKDFSKLIFSDNIGVELAGCNATIKGLDQKISSAAGECESAAVIAIPAPGVDFKHLFFTTIIVFLQYCGLYFLIFTINLLILKISVIPNDESSLASKIISKFSFFKYRFSHLCKNNSIFSF